MMNVSLAWLCTTVEGVYFPNTLTDGVPNGPKGCSEGFCHFCHPITSGIQKFARPAKSVKRTFTDASDERPPTPTVESLGERLPFGNIGGQRFATSSSGVD